METVKAVDISARGMVCAMTPRKAALGSILMLIQLLMLQQTEAFPLSGDQAALPPGTELYEETLQRQELNQDQDRTERHFARHHRANHAARRNIHSFHCLHALP